MTAVTSSCSCSCCSGDDFLPELRVELCGVSRNLSLKACFENFCFANTRNMAYNKQSGLPEIFFQSRHF